MISGSIARPTNLPFLYGSISLQLLSIFIKNMNFLEISVMNLRSIPQLIYKIEWQWRKQREEELMFSLDRPLGPTIDTLELIDGWKGCSNDNKKIQLGHGLDSLPKTCRPDSLLIKRNFSSLNSYSFQFTRNTGKMIVVFG